MDTGLPQCVQDPELAQDLSWLEPQKEIDIDMGRDPSQQAERVRKPLRSCIRIR